MSSFRVLAALALAALSLVLVFFLFRGEGPEALEAPAVRADSRAADGRTDSPAVAEAPAPEAGNGEEAVRETAAEATLPPTSPSGADTAKKPVLTVRGRVVDEYGNPVPGASVRLLPTMVSLFVHDLDERIAAARAESGPDGRFLLAVTEPQTRWTVRVSHPNYALVQRKVPPPAKDSRDVDLGELVLELGGRIAGHVVDENGAPVAGARIRAWTRQPTEGASAGLLVLGTGLGRASLPATSAADGSFELQGVAPGPARVVAQKDGYVSGAVKEIDVEKGGTVSGVRIELAHGVAIAGVVVGPDGKGLGGVEVKWDQAVIDLSDVTFESSVSSQRTLTTKENGWFEITGLREGAYTLSFSKDGFLSRELSDVDAGRRDLRVVMSRGGIVFGVVRDRRSGQPVGDARVSVQTVADNFGTTIRVGDPLAAVSGEKAAALSGLAAQPGLYACSDLRGERVKVVVEAAGYARTSIGPVDVPPGGRVRVDVELVPESAISGRVLRPDGNALPGARVEIRRVEEDASGTLGARIVKGLFGDRARELGIELGEESASDTSDDEGRFRVAVGPGRYKVVARHPDWARSDERIVIVGEGESTEVDVAVRAAGRLVGHTFDADGQPLPGATVRVRLVPENGADPTSDPLFFVGGTADDERRSVESDEEGRFEIGGLVPGNYLARLERPRKENQALGVVILAGAQGPDGVPFAIEAGRTTTLDLALPPTGGLRGTVTVAGSPVVGAEVSLVHSDAQETSPLAALGAPSTRTDARGRFVFEDIEPNDYVLTVLPPQGPVPTKKEVTIHPRRTAEAHVSLPSGVITGRVLDAETGRPMAGVTVQVARDEEDAAATLHRSIVSMSISEGGRTSRVTVGGSPSLVTDAEGRFEARYLAPGAYRITISGGGIRPQTKKDVRLAANQRREGVNFEAEKGATLSVRVENLPQGEGFVFTSLKIENLESGETRNTGFVGGGPNETDGLAPGSYRVTATSGSRRGERVVDLVAGETTEITIRVE